jgi:hypothetical protein
VGGGVDKRDRQEGEKASLAPVIGRWAEACFPVGSQTTETELRELLKEAADSARDNFGPEEAIAWAEGYRFCSDIPLYTLVCNMYLPVYPQQPAYFTVLHLIVTTHSY